MRHDVARQSDLQERTVQISVNVNGTTHTDDVEPRTLLVHYIRENCGLTGTNVGCDT